MPQGINDAQATETPPPKPEVKTLGQGEGATGGHPETILGDSPVALSGGIRLLERAMQLVRERGGSDVHLLEGERPRVRIRGELMPLKVKDHPSVTRKDIEDILNFALTPEQKQTFEKIADVDFSLDFHEGTGRVNVGLSNGRKLYLTMRYLPSHPIPLDRLGMDVEMLKALVATDSGLIVVAGETSSGKTTTIVALLDYINHTRYGAITTIENPVEYVLANDKCLITQREIGRDAPTFRAALRACVRKNPDVVLVGEIRDEETASVALNAAETGIQTFCTLHAVGAISAITRLGYIMIGGGHDAAEFHQRLSNVLRGIVSQELVRTADGKGIVPVYEILNITFSEKDYLRARNFHFLEQSLESDHNISRGECIHRLWHQVPRRIDEETIRKLFGDQYNLAMNRLGDHSGWKPLVSAMG